MAKKLLLIFGSIAANAVMKEIAATQRAHDKTVEVNLRSADHFTADQIEPAEAVLIIGDFPKIEEAYAEKAEVNVMTLEEAEKTLETALKQLKDEAKAHVQTDTLPQTTDKPKDPPAPKEPKAPKAPKAPKETKPKTA